MSQTLQGRHALVCGASQGIGQACAEALAHAGASVTVLSRSAEALEQARASLPGDTHTCLACDLNDYARVGDLVAQHIGQHGPVHILINNSGGPKSGPILDATPDDFLAGLTPHVLGGQSMVQAVLPGMRAAGYGRIINIVSTSVVTPIMGLGVSNTVRGAINNWMRTLAAELGPDGITVNNILPGFVGTDRLSSLIQARAEKTGSTPEDIEAGWMNSIPMGRFADPKEVGDVCAFLASPAAAYVTGVNLPVDGGRLAAR